MTERRRIWEETETVLLDMDGTLLDLAFDNRFWLERVPRRHAEQQGLDFDTALADLKQRMNRVNGQLQWYCLDYWSEALGFDLEALKRQCDSEIRLLPGVEHFLDDLTASGRRVAIATNAHPQVLAIKLARTGLDRLVPEIHTAHEFGAAKESPLFWQRLEAEMGFAPARTLFVDDSLPVLASARDHGIAHLTAVARPASDQPPRPISDFPAVDAIPELGPVPPRDQ
ncbi:GMP/IMP nucleotidase [Gammaproteobacteria bacterium AB-CW1]|uniref:GMP/IMP nucleotidase n=1 Tax=Natronospira elongata TaxID=3110268 RepID=A0AAP6JJ74_9GAMM|nr:GMP/IMP nucleotidase [Gammaproteobacteria bacterium AB-CW1]